MVSQKYVHGYSRRETERLYDQAGAVRDFLHHDSVFPAGSLVLEAGCGVGAQTVTLAQNNPRTKFVSIDISSESLAKAEKLIRRNKIRNVEFQQADLFHLPFKPASFDHLFVCYVLEHLAEPVKALRCLKKKLKPGGSVTVIEGDHGSCYFHPETAAAMKAWQCLIRVQASLGGDSLIGRRLYPLLAQAGLKNIRVSPRMIYIDQSQPVLMKAFTGRTITPMVQGVEQQALKMKLIDRRTWDQGIRDLYAITRRKDGTFCYTFFKAAGIL